MAFESISQESLNSTNKGHNRVADYRELIRSLHQHGIAAHLGIMFGFDQDDRGIFRRTVEFLEEASVDVTTMSMVVPIPGTPTFQRWQAEGRILTTDWSKYDGKKHCVFRPARMSPEELVAGTEWAARRFYSLGSIARRMWGSRRGCGGTCPGTSATTWSSGVTPSRAGPPAGTNLSMEGSATIHWGLNVAGQPAIEGHEPVRRRRSAGRGHPCADEMAVMGRGLQLTQW
jgi:hypothetical protein